LQRKIDEIGRVEDLDDEVRIRPVAQPVKLRGLLSDPTDTVPLTRLLELDHRWEIAHDEMRQAEWDMMPKTVEPRELKIPKKAKTTKAKTPKHLPG